MAEVKKNTRILDLYARLLKGEIVSKENMAVQYGVDGKSIERDINSIRTFLEMNTVENGVYTEITYDRKEKG